MNIPYCLRRAERLFGDRPALLLEDRTVTYREFATGARRGASRLAELGDAFVLVSQSGASAETVAALDAISGRPVVVISARGDSPLARAAKAWLPLGPVPDTPGNRARFGGPMSRTGRMTAPVGN